MNWDDVRVFLSVARTGQILAAGRRLGLNHATVARRLTSLEEDLSVKLFERSTSGCVLTDKGSRFLPRAEAIEAEMLAAEAEIADDEVSISGTVRIGAPDGFGVAFLAPRLGQLTEKHPDLTVQLVPVPRSFSLSRREADIAITVERPEHGRLIARKLTDYSLGLYASSSYLDTCPPPETLKDLKDHSLIGAVEDLIYSQALNYAADFAKDWSARFEIASALGQTEAVRAGAGIGVLHSFIARSDPDLVRLLPDIEVKRAYWTVSHESTRPLRPVTATLEFLNDLVLSEREIFA
ncbi:LysR family transcriptional regulator [Roseibium sp. TrichSKD4]|uniref:LysR family transcriptional regulator n=1 Tax=Roseibium sp. TrichSKD4 TaxID=744980 RepID=UPI0001E570CA|nr:LysR family transcriptional regulator [Roseibium sp. TrichSKD4]EFO30493.1 LysR family transcriptional regulator [Roseibium sp. TrichSKD4]